MVDGDHERAGGMGRAHEREAETRDGAGTHVGGFTSMPWVPNDAKETGGREKRRAFLGSRAARPSQQPSNKEAERKIPRSKGTMRPRRREKRPRVRETER